MGNVASGPWQWAPKGDAWCPEGGARDYVPVEAMQRGGDSVGVRVEEPEGGWR